MGAGAVQDHLAPFPRILRAGAGWRRPAERRRPGRDAHPRPRSDAAVSDSWPVRRERDPYPAARLSATWQERAARDGAAPWCVKAEAEPECLVSSQGTHSSPCAAGRRGGVRGGGRGPLGETPGPGRGGVSRPFPGRLPAARGPGATTRGRRPGLGLAPPPRLESGSGACL